MPGKWVGSTRSDRLPVDWSQRCAQVRRRDGDLCWWCGKGGAVPGKSQIDHKYRGDDHSLSNLGLIHTTPCHAQKSSAEGNQERWRYRMARPAEQHPGYL